MVNAYNFNVKRFTSYSIGCLQDHVAHKLSSIQKGTMKPFQAHYSLEWNHFKPITLLNVAAVASNMNHIHIESYNIKGILLAERGIGLAKATSFLNILCAPAIINFHIMLVQEGLSRAFHESNGPFLNVPEEPHCIYCLSGEYDSNLFPSMLALQATTTVNNSVSLAMLVCVTSDSSIYFIPIWCSLDCQCF